MNEWSTNQGICGLQFFVCLCLPMNYLGPAGIQRIRTNQSLLEVQRWMYFSNKDSLVCLFNTTTALIKAWSWFLLFLVSAKQVIKILLNLEKNNLIELPKKSFWLFKNGSKQGQIRWGSLLAIILKDNNVSIVLVLVWRHCMRGKERTLQPLSHLSDGMALIKGRMEASRVFHQQTLEQYPQRRMSRTLAPSMGSCSIWSLMCFLEAHRSLVH